MFDLTLSQALGMTGKKDNDFMSASKLNKVIHANHSIQHLETTAYNTWKHKIPLVFRWHKAKQRSDDLLQMISDPTL